MRKKISLLLAFLLITLPLAACAGDTAGTSGTQNGESAEAGDVSTANGGDGTDRDISEQTYVMCTYNSTEYFQRLLWEGFQEAGEMLGVNTVLVGDTGEDVLKYLNRLDNAIAMDPDGICVMCLDGDSYVDGINKAIDLGIPVVTVAPDSPNSERISFLGIDNMEIGRFGASIVGDAVGGEGEVLILTKVGMPDCADMISGFEEYAAEHYPGLSTVVVPASLELTDQTTKAAAAISANPNINAAYCPLGWQAVAIYQACEELGIEPFPIIGADCELAQLELIRDGKIMGTIRQGTAEQGFWACMSLYLIRNAFIPEAFFPETIYSGFDLVDQSNVEEEIEFYYRYN